MSDKMDVKKLTEYRSQINGSVIDGISDSIAKLNDTLSMISDLQRINEALAISSSEKEQEVIALQAENAQIKKEIESLRNLMSGVEAKEKLYSEMELSMAKVSSLLEQLQKREEALVAAEKKLASERNAFEQEKERIISEKNDAKEKANKYLTEKNDAIRSRDVAIAEKSSAIDDKEKAEQLQHDAEEKLEELREELSECTKAGTQADEELSKANDLIEWYKGYAYAIDRKIINCFKYNQNDDLESHYYSYLSNPDKLADIRIHFPDFILEEPENFEKIENEETSNTEVEIAIESDAKEDIDEKADKIEEKKDKKEKKEKKEKKDKKDRP